MLVLIFYLLDLSKIQSGTFSVEPHAGRLKDIVILVIDGMTTLAHSRQQTIELKISSGSQPNSS